MHIKTISSPTDSISLLDDLNALADWSLHWKLSYNTSKFKLLRVLPPNHTLSTHNYSINNHNIDLSSQHHDLGILLSNGTVWDDHYTLIISKAYKTFYFIRSSTSNSHSSHTKLSPSFV